MALKAVVDDVRQRVLAGEVEVEGLGAARRAENAADAAAPYKAASSYTSAQWPLAVLAAAHVAARGRCRWSVGLLALPSEIAAGP